MSAPNQPPRGRWRMSRPFARIAARRTVPASLLAAATLASVLALSSAPVGAQDQLTAAERAELPAAEAATPDVLELKWTTVSGTYDDVVYTDSPALSIKLRLPSILDSHDVDLINFGVQLKLGTTAEWPARTMGGSRPTGVPASTGTALVNAVATFTFFGLDPCTIYHIRAHSNDDSLSPYGNSTPTYRIATNCTEVPQKNLDAAEKAGIYSDAAQKTHTIAEGGSFTYGIRLRNAGDGPTADVVVTPTASGDHRGLLSLGGAVTFTSDDWTGSKQVTVTAPDDSACNAPAGNNKFFVTHTITSTDTNFDQTAEQEKNQWRNWSAMTFEIADDDCPVTAQSPAQSPGFYSGTPQPQPQSAPETGAPQPQQAEQALEQTSAQQEVVPPLPPGMVGDVAVTAKTRRLTVSWSAPLRGGDPDSYTVRINPVGGGKRQTKTVDAEKTSVTFRRLTPGTTYKVWVRAGNDEGTGVRARTTATTLQPTPHPAPQQQTPNQQPAPQPEQQARDPQPKQQAPAPQPEPQTQQQVPDPQPAPQPEPQQQVPDTQPESEPQQQEPAPDHQQAPTPDPQPAPEPEPQQPAQQPQPERSGEGWQAYDPDGNGCVDWGEYLPAVYDYSAARIATATVLDIAANRC